MLKNILISIVLSTVLVIGTIICLNTIITLFIKYFPNSLTFIIIGILATILYEVLQEEIK